MVFVRFSSSKVEEKMILIRKIAVVAFICRCSSTSFAAFSLSITEIWPGNDPGTDLTADWFEITNTGNMAWTAAVDGDLYFDDDSADITTADLLSGVASIAPGESVVFVDGDMAGAMGFSAVWGPDVTLPQVGSYEGAGLSQGGDTVNIWISMGPPTGTPSFSGSYPDALFAMGASYDLTLGAFSTVGNAAGAVATTATNDIGQRAIGSPGTVAVPEPACLVLLTFGLLAAGRYRRN
jgi:hypothetical protein